MLYNPIDWDSHVPANVAKLPVQLQITIPRRGQLVGLHRCLHAGASTTSVVHQNT